MNDLKFACRQLLRNRGFTAVAVLTLALGIGANAAIFTLIDALLLRMLPGVKEPHQLVLVKDSRHTSFAYPHYEQFRDGCQSFSGLIVTTGLSKRRMIVSGAGGGEAESAWAGAVSGDFFSVLGVAAAAGRTLISNDDRHGNPQAVVVLSHGFWEDRFGLHPAVIGKTILLDDTPFTIVGVAQQGFCGLEVGRSPDLWWPIQMLPLVDQRKDALATKDSRWLQIMGRLKSGVSEEGARAELDVVFQRMQSEQAAAYGLTGRERRQFMDLRIELQAAGTGYTGLRSQFRKPLYLLLAISDLVLLVACTNLAGLLLARGAARQREFSVRTALGAGRFILVRQLVTENALLALGGGLLGLVLAQWGAHLLAGYLPGYGRTVELKLTPDRHVLLFTLAVSAVTALLFGLVPALRTTRVDLVTGLKDQTGGATRRESGQLLNRLLVVSQIALSCLLLIGAGLFARTLAKLKAWDPGFNRERLLVFGIDHPRIKNFDARQVNLHKEMLRRLESLPGVQSASLAGVLSLSGNIGHRYRPKLVTHGAIPDSGEDSRAYGIGVAPRYFRTMGIPLLRGRDLGPEDELRAGASSTNQVLLRVVFSESLARRLFGEADPVGKQMHDAENPKLTLEIVGVARDAHHQKLRAERLPMFYHLDFIWPTFYVRTLGNPLAVAAGLRQVVREIDPQAEISGLRTMDDVVNGQLLQERTLSNLAGFFSLSALALACLGLYGILSYGVVRRTREIGVRLALGAQTRDVLALVIRQGMVLTLVGCAAGIALAVASTRLLSSLLYGVTGTDPLTLASATGLLGAIALLACWIPARRASRVDPMVALRYE
ncbi:MAG: ABC transporter permease [Verrucomicrobia bacterium]|nr:ABC transporter permease [Verrucomicrobiota bacterium]